MRDDLGRFSKVKHDCKWVEEHSTPVTESGCWLWDGYVAPNGYGNIRFTDKNMLAHRVSFEAHNGYLPDLVRHTCDNPCCVNPAHLLHGDKVLNGQDMIDRGRGKGQFKKRLSDKIKEEIRSATGTQESIAKTFSISPSGVSRIKNSKDTNRTRYSK